MNVIRQETIIKEHTRKAKTKLEDKLKGIPVEKVRITLSEEESVCPYCNTPYEVLGEEVVRRELQYVPASVKALEYVSVTYICPQCKDDDVPYIIKTKAPKGLMKIVLLHRHRLPGQCIRSMLMPCLYTVRKRTGTSMVSN